MIRAIILCASAIFFLSSPGAASISRHYTTVERNLEISRVEADLDRADQTAARVDLAIALLVDTAELNLRINGYESEADQLRSEYEHQYRGYLENAIWTKDLGDHKPLSEWLAGWYDKLELILGEQVMKYTRLVDIKTVNFAVPVVFDPRREKGVWDDPDPKGEYSEHFVPLSGVVTYWSVWGACTAATSGSGAVYACSPIAMVSENIMVNFIAPGLSDRVYDRANKP